MAAKARNDRSDPKSLLEMSCTALASGGGAVGLGRTRGVPNGVRSASGRSVGWMMLEEKMKVETN